MNVVHFTLGSMNPDSSNGINRVIEGLASSANQSSLANVEVLTVKTDLPTRGKHVVQRDGFTVTICRSVDLAIEHLARRGSHVDVVHMHNAWSWPNYRMARYLRSRNQSYVVTPHAAFLPDRMQVKTWRKIAFHTALQKTLLDRALFVHAVSREEITSISKYTDNQRIEFIPNGSVSPPVPGLKSGRSPRLRFGFVGRLAREKNTLGLIRAVGMLPIQSRSAMELHIFGEDKSEYGRLCHAEVRKLGLEFVVTFRGAVSVLEKWECLRELDVYIQPSFSEASSVAILEAMSLGLPVIATRTCCVAYWNGNSFLKMVEPIPSELASGIQEWLNERVDLNQRGRDALDFFRRSLAWDHIAKRMIDSYKTAGLLDVRTPPRQEA